MEYIIIALIAWILPIFLFCHIAENAGQSVGKTFVLTLFLGWIGGILAVCLLPHDQTPESQDRQDTLARRQQEERARREQSLQALNRPLSEPKKLSESRKRQISQYYGGTRK